MASSDPRAIAREKRRKARAEQNKARMAEIAKRRKDFADAGIYATDFDPNYPGVRFVDIETGVTVGGSRNRDPEKAAAGVAWALEARDAMQARVEAVADNAELSLAEANREAMKQALAHFGKNAPAAETKENQ